MTKEKCEHLDKKLDELISIISNEHLSKLCYNLVGPKGRYREQFLIAPAAKGFHHAYPGGLLEHSLQVADFCISDCKTLNKYNYEALDADLLITASLLHDIAKIEEYEIYLVEGDKTYYQFTESGKMIGHLCLSAMWVFAEIDKINDFPLELKNHLLHILLSHHGRVEWGNAVKPLTKEAEFFHMADHRSATIAKGH